MPSPFPSPSLGEFEAAEEACRLASTLEPPRAGLSSRAVALGHAAIRSAGAAEIAPASPARRVAYLPLVLQDRETAQGSTAL